MNIIDASLVQIGRRIGRILILRYKREKNKIVWQNESSLKSQAVSLYLSRVVAVKVTHGKTRKQIKSHS